MKEKELSIIESAIKLFAKKGFATTSIQEIATESGISKGAFYLYFKSKDALLFAILQYYFSMIQNNVRALQEQDLPPRELFSLQLASLIETFIDHKDFIIMQTREQAIPLNNEIRELILKMQSDTHQFYREGLSSIYGEKIAPFLWDLTLTLEGIFQSFMKVLLFENNSAAAISTSRYILRRMDSIVEGMTDESPFLTTDKVERLMQKTRALFLDKEYGPKEILQEMKQELAKMEEAEELEVSLEVLENEIQNPSPRLAVVQGMLSNFGIHPQFDRMRASLLEYYQKK